MPVNIIKSAQIASSFGQAALRYDEFAELQREVADTLLSGLPATLVDDSGVRILDLGCGTGYCTEQLLKRYPATDIIALDIASKMLECTQEKLKKNPVEYVCADAQELPFADNNFSLIVSSLTIQWCFQLRQLFAEFARVLRPGGEAFISSFGPLTLQELKGAWESVDSYTHVNSFVEVETLEKTAQEQGLVFSCKREIVTRYYASFFELAHELKGVGAHNMSDAQSKGLTGREKIKQVKNAFELSRVENKGIGVSYEVLYLRFRKRAANE